MPAITGKLLPTVGYTTGRGTDAWDIEIEPSLRKLDALVQGNAISFINTLPAPVEGAVYIIGTSPTGIAAGWANRVVRANAFAGTWDSWVPVIGWHIAVGADDYRWNGTAWITESKGVPMLQEATTPNTNFGGVGSPTADANWLKNNIGLAMSDARALNWRGGMWSSDTHWGLSQDASVSSSFKPFVLQDGQGSIWYKQDPLGATYKHEWTGATKFGSAVETFSTLTLRGNLLTNGDINLQANSADGADTAATSLCGGGSSNSNRGGFVSVRGNERPTSGGTVTIAAGDTNAGAVQGEIQMSTGGSLRATLKANGELNVSSGAFRVGSLGGLLASTSGLVRAAVSSDFPGVLNALSQLANGNGFLRNSGAGVVTWEAAIPAASFSTLGISNFGGTGITGYAYPVLNNYGVGFQDGRGLSWRGGIFNTDAFWGLAQDASLATSFKPMVFKDGANNTWYKMDPNDATFKHYFKGKASFDDNVDIAGAIKQAGTTRIDVGGFAEFVSLRLQGLMAAGTLPLLNANGYVQPSSLVESTNWVQSSKGFRCASANTAIGDGTGTVNIIRGILYSQLVYSYFETNSSTTLTMPNANDAFVFRCGTSGVVTTLPLASSVALGTILLFRYSGASGSWTIQRQGTDVIDDFGLNGATVTSFTLTASSTSAQGKCAELMAVGSNKWERIR